MPQYNLTPTQMQILTTWLYEPFGYLDTVALDIGQSARQALQAQPTLDVTQWVRDHTAGGWSFNGEPAEAESPMGLAMVWWIRAHDQVNITPPSRPPETAQWVAILNGWDASINAGFARTPQAQRDASTVTMYDANGQVSGTIPSGSHLAQQQQIISKVLGVLT